MYLLYSNFKHVVSRLTIRGYIVGYRIIFPKICTSIFKQHCHGVQIEKSRLPSTITVADQLNRSYSDYTRSTRFPTRDF